MVPPPQPAKSAPAGDPGFRRGGGAGSCPVSSHRRDGEVAEKSETVGRSEFQFGRKRKVGPLQVRGFDGRLLADPSNGPQGRAHLCLATGQRIFSRGSGWESVRAVTVCL